MLFPGGATKTAHLDQESDVDAETCISQLRPFQAQKLNGGKSLQLK